MFKQITIIFGLTIMACTPAQTNQINDVSILAKGKRDTVCLLINQAISEAVDDDEHLTKAKNLCDAGKPLQDIIDSLATPCENRLEKGLE